MELLDEAPRLVPVDRLAVVRQYGDVREARAEPVGRLGEDPLGYELLDGDDLRDAAEPLREPGADLLDVAGAGVEEQVAARAGGSERLPVGARLASRGVPRARARPR
ncbi:MAG TPA: hypothetical protein VFM41_13550 [Gaiella sp.]|nr:hypothetical protein [Gaiella sp.]